MFKVIKYVIFISPPPHTQKKKERKKNTERFSDRVALK